MDETAHALLELNRAFYRERGLAFSATRERAWRGWKRLLAWLPARSDGARLRVLDIGCGNGRLARFLDAQGVPIDYTGIDASEPLLEIARRALPLRVAPRLLGVDFVALPPEHALPDGPFDLVALFGVLHGVPGRSRRHALLAAAAHRLAPGGLLAFTAWRFAVGDALRHRIVSWDAPAARALGIRADRLEPGDHLVAWGAERSLRYACAIGADEIDALSRLPGLVPLARYCDDGRNGQTNAYALLRREDRQPTGTR